MMPPGAIKILHVITDLNMGGAEMVLYRLLAAQNRKEFSSQVVSLTDVGSVGERIADLGIPVSSLGVRPGFPSPKLVTGLAELIRACKPDLIQSWMYHADLASGLASRFTGNVPVVWGLHHTVADKASLKPATYLVARTNAWLSHVIPENIVCCAEATRDTHVRLGYAVEKMSVIPNGIDPKVFRPDPVSRKEVRQELGVSDDTPLIGLCARFDPQKDHENFIRAAGILHQNRPDAHFVLWGADINAGNHTLRGWISAAGVAEGTHLLGLRQDSAKIMAALDFFGQGSASEAFPVAVGEAMACEIPCVVTDVGDSAALVGDTGKIVPRRDSAALADAWGSLLCLSPGDRLRLGTRARQRIVDHYSLERMASAYSQLYRDIIAQSK